MTKYYIHISDEKPTNFAKGISFEVDSESNAEDKLYVVNKHEHEEMVEEWDSVKNEYLRKVTNDVISILSDTNVALKSKSFSVKYFSIYSSCIGDLKELIKLTLSSTISTAVT